MNILNYFNVIVKKTKEMFVGNSIIKQKQKENQTSINDNFEEILNEDEFKSKKESDLYFSEDMNLDIKDFENDYMKFLHEALILDKKLEKSKAMIYLVKASELITDKYINFYFKIVLQSYDDEEKTGKLWQVLQSFEKNIKEYFGRQENKSSVEDIEEKKKQLGFVNKVHVLGYKEEVVENKNMSERDLDMLSDLFNVKDFESKKTINNSDIDTEEIILEGLKDIINQKTNKEFDYEEIKDSLLFVDKEIEIEKDKYEDYYANIKANFEKDNIGLDCNELNDLYCEVFLNKEKIKEKSNILSQDVIFDLNIEFPFEKMETNINFFNTEEDYLKCELISVIEKEEDFKIRLGHVLNQKETYLNTKTIHNRICLNNYLLSLDVNEAISQIYDLYKEKNIKLKAKSPLMFEFAISANKTFFLKHSLEYLNTWIEKQVDFVNSYFNSEIKFAVLHFDELSPHLHFILSAEKEQVRKYKTKNGYVEKTSYVQNKTFEKKTFLAFKHELEKINNLYNLSYEKHKNQNINVLDSMFDMDKIKSKRKDQFCKNTNELMLENRINKIVEKYNKPKQLNLENIMDKLDVNTKLDKMEPLFAIEYSNNVIKKQSKEKTKINVSSISSEAMQEMKQKLNKKKVVAKQKIIKNNEIIYSENSETDMEVLDIWSNQYNDTCEKLQSLYLVFNNLKTHQTENERKNKTAIENITKEYFENILSEIDKIPVLTEILNEGEIYSIKSQISDNSENKFWEAFENIKEGKEYQTKVKQGLIKKDREKKFENNIESALASLNIEEIKK